MFLIVSDGSSSAKVNDILTAVMDNLGGALFNLVWRVYFCGLRWSGDDHSKWNAFSRCFVLSGRHDKSRAVCRWWCWCWCRCLAISVPTGAYGSAVVSIEADEVEAAARAARQSALRQAGRPDETPELIWLSATPGVEERVIASIQEAIGTGVPICGGSAVDNSVSGDWVVFDRSARFGSGIAISGIFPSVRVGYAFLSGYRPTSTQGQVTRANDGCIVSIDDQPVAQVYNDWTNGKIDNVLETGGSLISNTSLSPLDRRRDAVAGFDYFLLSHLESVSPDGGLGLFSDIEVGDEIVLMEGSEDNLVTRAPRVAENALEMARLDKDHISGALVIYCAGFMLTVQDRMTEVAAGLSDTLGGKPFLGTFTFGEQGCFIGGSNHHGNLMISVVVFGV